MQTNGLEKLKNIGIEKIREVTNLDIGKIQDILDKRFDRLDPVRAKGFIQMLEKDFNLDLSFWLEEYAQFQNQKNQKNQKQTDKTIEHSQKNTALFWLSCIGLLVVGGGLLYWISSKPHIKETPLVSQATQEQTKVLPKQEESSGIASKEPIEVVAQNPVESKEEVSQEQKMQTKPLYEYGVSVFPQMAYNEENVLFITAKAPLWIGIINLDTKKRVAKTKKEFEIPLDKQLLINIARGGFNASFDDEEKYFNTYKPVYLIHTIQGGLREISKEEFMSLNGGVEW